MTMLMQAPTVPPDGALLVRVLVPGPLALGALPPVPAPHRVTISLGSVRLRAWLPPDLASRGYRLVGVHDGTASDAEAVLLVRASLLDARPDWARAIASHADGVYACDLGPVRRVFRDLIDRHIVGA